MSIFTVFIIRISGFLSFKIANTILWQLQNCDIFEKLLRKKAQKLSTQQEER